MWREWIYVPRSPEYALPWLLGPVISMVLALFGLPAGKIADFGVAWRGVLAYAIAFVAVAVLNALVFWTHVRAQYLTWQTARRAFISTYFLLTVFYLTIFGLVIVYTGQASINIPAGNVRYTMRSMLLGACSMLPALLVSALWKSEEPGVTNTRLQRMVALQLLRRLHTEHIGTDDYRTLVDVLNMLPTTARAARAHLIGKADRALSTSWASAAQDLYAVLRDRAVDDYYLPAIRESIQDTLMRGLANLEREA